VLDWEIWTVSDPRIDVGWFLMTFEPDGLPSAVRTRVAGWPPRQEVLDVYETTVAAPVEDLRWFSALARLRSAAAMSLNVKHNRRRPEPSARIEAYAAILPGYLDAAQRLLDAMT
jgi:aminoglycoside phosphotransferase (APT) family kinase protein